MVTAGTGHNLDNTSGAFRQTRTTPNQSGSLWPISHLFFRRSTLPECELGVVAGTEPALDPGAHHSGGHSAFSSQPGIQRHASVCGARIDRKSTRLNSSHVKIS